MLLIINLGIILTLLIIILFNIKNTKRQIIITLGVLTILIIFKLICDKMIKNNKSNDEVNNYYLVNNDNANNEPTYYDTSNKSNINDYYDINSFNLFNNFKLIQN